jgi:hypothetical protein
MIIYIFGMDTTLVLVLIDRDRNTKTAAYNLTLFFTMLESLLDSESLLLS